MSDNRRGERPGGAIVAIACTPETRPVWPAVGTPATNLSSGEMGSTESASGQVFDALESVHAKSLVILMVPAFALALRVVTGDRKIRLSECMTFALHLYTFALIWLCALFPAVAIGLRLFVWAGGHITAEGFDEVVSLFEAGVIGWYVAVALATVWNLPRWRCLGSALLLITVMVLLLRPYHFVVFAVTLLST